MYKLDSVFPNEAFCLYQNSNNWEVYYSEKEQKSELIIFSTEVACQYLYELI